MQILIAEDDPMTRTMLATVLGKWGYEVQSVATGIEAWERLQQPNAPALALLDWEMPGLSGVQVCQRLRALNRPEPVYLLLLTARCERSDLIRALDAGADDYLTKPFDTAELRARLAAGRRILDLLHEQEAKMRLQGVLEMAGAVCHELSQPMQVLAVLADLMRIDERAARSEETARRIRQQVDRLGALTWKLARITDYRTQNYHGKTRIVEINGAIEAR
jgi:phosphoserine phosphatase RsbU/P